MRNISDVIISLNWRQPSCCTIRPEVRLDRSNVEAANIRAAGVFDDFGTKEMLTTAFAMIFW